MNEFITDGGQIIEQIGIDSLLRVEFRFTGAGVVVTVANLNVELPRPTRQRCQIKLLH